MKTFDDKSEGKTSIHRPKTMFIKNLIFGFILWRKNLKGLYIIILCCYSTLHDFC